MVSLGKVTAPKPVNLPSQKKENNGNDASALLSKTSTLASWGGESSANNAHNDSHDDGHRLPPRVIPAQPSPAWGGAGLPEERQKKLELASREQFPTLGSEPERPSAESRDAAYPRGSPSQHHGGISTWDEDERGGYSEPPHSRGGRPGRRDEYGDDHGRGGPYGPYDHDRYPDEGDQYHRPYYRRRRPYYDDYGDYDYPDDRPRRYSDDRERGGYHHPYDNEDMYENRPGRGPYEGRGPYRGGYDNRRFGRGTGDMYSPRRGGYGGFREDYNYGRHPHGRRREDMRMHGDRYHEYEEEVEEEERMLSPKAAVAPPPPPPPPRRPPPPPPSVVQVENTDMGGADEPTVARVEPQAEMENEQQESASSEEVVEIKPEHTLNKLSPPKILRREPAIEPVQQQQEAYHPEPQQQVVTPDFGVNLEIDLGTEVKGSRPPSRMDGSVRDLNEDSFVMPVVPPSLQGLSLHPITFGEESAMKGSDPLSEAVQGFGNQPEHPPGLFTSMSISEVQGPQQPLMTFGTDSNAKLHTEEGLGLLLDGFNQVEKQDDKVFQPLQFGDILLPSTIDGCVDVESSGQTQTVGGPVQHTKDGRDSFKTRGHRGRGRGRGRGGRGRDSASRAAEKMQNGTATPPPPPPPPPPGAMPSDSGEAQKPSTKPVKPRKKNPTDQKKKQKGTPPPPGLSPNGNNAGTKPNSGKKPARKPAAKKKTDEPKPPPVAASQSHKDDA